MEIFPVSAEDGDGTFQVGGVEFEAKDGFFEEDAFGDNFHEVGSGDGFDCWRNWFSIAEGFDCFAGVGEGGGEEGEICAEGSDFCACGGGVVGVRGFGGGGIEGTDDGAERNLAGGKEVEVAGGKAIDESTVGGAEVVQAVVAVFEDEFGVEAGDGSIDNLEGIGGQATDGDAGSLEADDAGLIFFGRGDADGGHR